MYIIHQNESRSGKIVESKYFLYLAWSGQTISKPQKTNCSFYIGDEQNDRFQKEKAETCPKLFTIVKTRFYQSCHCYNNYQWTTAFYRTNQTSSSVAHMQNKHETNSATSTHSTKTQLQHLLK